MDDQTGIHIALPRIAWSTHRLTCTPESAPEALGVCESTKMECEIGSALVWQCTSEVFSLCLSFNENNRELQFISVPFLFNLPPSSQIHPSSTVTY